jgi:hypothetical protein
MVTQKRLLSLPEIELLRKLSQSLAMLDAIMSPVWECRYYPFKGAREFSELPRRRNLLRLVDRQDGT